MKRKGISVKARMVAVLAAGGLLAAAMPTAGLALGLIGPGNSLIAFTPASGNARLAELFAGQGKGTRLLRFTPAGLEPRANRAVTVAVRVDPQVARAITVRSAIQAAQQQVAAGPTVGITATRYNLGIARGYQSFVRPPSETPVLSRTLSDAAIPDLATFRPSPARPEEPSRFAGRIALEEQAKAGAAPRTLDSRSDQRVEVGGSYRLTQNLNVTAGLRYTQERDRLAPLADPAVKDSQAVYVGTQFRF